jgi:hypothetical protein
MATGISSANAATLFMKADRKAATPESTATCRKGLVLARITLRAMMSTTPELNSPRLITRTASTVMTAGCPNPAKASSPGMTPARTAAIRAVKATRS